jgi:predicted phage terminase large subunit-like protein
MPRSSPHRRRKTVRGADSLIERFVEALRRRNPDVGAPRTPDLLLTEWGKRYLPNYFQLPPSAMHLWLSGELDRCRSTRGARINVLAPRGSAKSTLGALCNVLRGAVERSETYVWIISATRDQARMHLKNVRHELETNAALARDYALAVGKGTTWTSASLELSNGVVVESFGAGQQLRGRRSRSSRPSLIVCDDVENDRLAASPRQRAECRDWFHGAVLKAGDQRTNVVNLATALHRDSLAMTLATTPGWTSATFSSILEWPVAQDLWREWEQLYCDVQNPAAKRLADDFFESRRDEMLRGAKVLWPEREGLYALMRMRVEEGPAAFDREKQNCPIDPSKCEWPQEFFDSHVWFDQWPDDLAIKVIALDPSKGSDSKLGDYSALVKLGVDGAGTMFVEADLARRPTTAMVADGVAHCAAFQPQALGVESNQFQHLLAEEFERELTARGLRSISACLIHNAVSKLIRIRRIGPLLARRRLRFLSGSPSTSLLVDQLRDFPLGDHDDGPDALEMAVRLADAVGRPPPSDGLGARLLSI